MRIRRQIAIRTDIKVGEVTASTTGDENFFARFFGFIDQQNRQATFTSSDSTHQSGSTGTDDDDIIMLYHVGQLGVKQQFKEAFNYAGI